MVLFILWFANSFKFRQKANKLSLLFGPGDVVNTIETKLMDWAAPCQRQSLH